MRTILDTFITPWRAVQLVSARKSMIGAATRVLVLLVAGGTGLMLADCSAEGVEAAGPPQAGTHADGGDEPLDSSLPETTPEGGPSDEAEAEDSAIDATDGTASGGDTGCDVPDATAFVALCGLLQNPGAETGDLTGWTSDPGYFEAAQQTTGTPAPFDGAWQFAAGSEINASLHQDVDVSKYSAQIDAGLLTARLSGFVRDWNFDDLAFLAIEARDGSGQLLGTKTTTGLDVAFWTRREISVRLPSGTRSVRAILRGERVQGADNDAYFDALDLCLDGESAGSDDEAVIRPYLTSLTHDGVSVNWEAATPIVGEVAYGSTPSLGSVIAATGVGAHQRARITGLSAGTRYYYRAQGPDWTGSVHSFLTAPATATSFRFAVWGDSQHGNDVFFPLVKHMQASSPDFVLSVGDVVPEPSETNFRYKLLWPLSPISAEAPVAIAPGNHDALDELLLFDRHLDQPGHCFFWTYGQVFFLVLDTNDPLPGGNNEACLDAAFSSASFAASEFQIALFHAPPRIEYWGGGGVTETAWVRSELEPRLASAGIDLVFTGHSHLYAYGPPQGTSGVTWVTTGGGGGGLEPAADLTYDWPEITVVHLRHHFLDVTVDGKLIKVSAIADTGEELHTFSIAH